MFAGNTVRALLDAGAEEAPAIAAPELAPLTYGRLRALVDTSLQRLNALGLGREDRIAMVLPNGPHMAAAFLAVTSGATAAPLNPTYRVEEFEFYLTDLRAKALMLEQGVASPARDAAARLKVPIIEVRPDRHGAAGLFALEPQSPMGGRAARPGAAEAGDVALVLHTSGTTARPKIVPLTDRNITASARHIATTLHLSEDDVCLNIMPLFHIHGLMAAVLSSLGAGAQVCCSSGFNPLKFFHWLDEVRPTWYTAAPSMHRGILARAERNPDIVSRSRLRFIRSSSAALRPQLMADLERTFRTAVVQSYGMTEASHQVASNPLPPRPRKPGTVGPAAGPEIAIMDDTGALLPRDSMGEVIIRGPNVTAGYEDNPEANQAAFINGWFRTGDQGRLDADGYLWLTGRLKELINRGGEKVSPLEIEAILMDHPDVQQVVSFAVPDESLGEEIAVAVVRREGSRVTDRDLRRFAAAHLADFKVPRTVVFVPEIPKGTTGKLQRIGLAAKLGLEQSSEP